MKTNTLISENIGNEKGEIPTAENTTDKPTKSTGFPRLAFSLMETADMLGLSYITIYRLVQRGKLKTCGDLRTKLISKTEIDRFLAK